MTEGALNNLEEDALVEILNIGMGRAAASLAHMVGEEITLSIPRLAVVDHSGAMRLIGEHDLQQALVAAVRQNFHGPFHGSALLVYPEEKSLELVRLLLKAEESLASLTELEREGLLEVGNVILNACLGSIANMMGLELNCDLPEYLYSRFDNLVNKPFENKHSKAKGQQELVLFLYVDFITQGSAIKGYVVLLLDVLSMAQIKRELGRFLENLQNSPG